MLRAALTAPCIGCTHRRRCDREQLACRRFAAWAKDGGRHPELPTEPTHSQARRTLFPTLED
jgi:hypothetical protein